MIAIHKNDLTAYLSNWKLSMDTTTIAKSGKDKKRPIPKTFQAISSQTSDLSTILMCLDSKLRILETKSPCAMDYQAYGDAIVFLKAAYLFFRILLDTVAGVIEYFYKKNEQINLPGSFNHLLKKEENGKLPNDLSAILKKARVWFPELRDRRVDLVHHYEYFLILFRKNKNGASILEHFNIAKANKFRNYGGIRQYFGFLLSGYQRLVDGLLDHFDTKFRTWYGIIASKSSRTQTQMEGNAACILWWAAKYGEYKHPDLIIQE